VASLYRDPNGRYYVNFVDANGKRARESTGTADANAAKIALNRIAAELDKAKALGLGAVRQLKGMTFAEFVKDEYLPHCTPPNRKPETYDGLVDFAEVFQPCFGEMLLASVTTADCQRFPDRLKVTGYKRGREARSYSPARINRFRSGLSGIFTEAAKRGYVTGNPVKDTSKLEEDNERVRYLLHGERERLLEFAPSGSVPSWSSRSRRDCAAARSSI